MDVINDEDDAMAAMMGLNGFGSTKVVPTHSLDVQTDGVSTGKASHR